MHKGITFSLIVLALAGCLDSGSTPDESGTDDRERWTHAEWTEALTAPMYDSITSQVHYIEATDGTQLSLTLHLPDGAPRDAALPTLLQITPYQAGRNADPDGATGSPSGSWGSIVERGAAYVEADARGTNGSEGCLDFGGSADRDDARVFTEWIRAQPWSNGVVVTDGVSHPGMGSIVANAAVPDLDGALAHAPVVSYYQDQWIQGARLEQINEFYQTTELQPAWYQDANGLLAQAAPCTGQTLLDFGQVQGPFTDMWADRDLSRHLDDAASPLLMTQGFVDLNVHPDHVQFYWDALPEDYPKHMILGWWYHGWPDMDGHIAETFTDMRLRWFEQTLFGNDVGLWDEPRVLVEDSRGVWHEGDDWPLEPSETVQLFPSDTGALGTEAADGSVSYNDPLPGQVSRGDWGDASVVFRTEPLESAKMVNGAPTVHLVASSNVDSTKWVAYLLDEAPDGSWEWISHGYADSHSWGAEDEWNAMSPGTEYTWDLLMFPTAVVVDAGHRVTLVIASQDPGLSDLGSNCFSDHRGGCYSPTGILPAETAGRATNTVHLGPHGTHVELAWVDPALTLKAQRPQEE